MGSSPLNVGLQVPLSGKLFFYYICPMEKHFELKTKSDGGRLQLNFHEVMPEGSARKPVQFAIAVDDDVDGRNLFDSFEKGKSYKIVPA